MFVIQVTRKRTEKESAGDVSAATRGISIKNQDAKLLFSVSCQSK